jgi:DNA polymerase I
VKNEFKIFDNAKKSDAAEISLNAELPKEFSPEINQKFAQNNFSNIKISKISSPEIINKLNTQAALNGIVTIDFYQNFFTISTNKFGEVPTEIFYFEAEQKFTNEAKTISNDLFDFAQKSENDLENQGFGVEILEKILSNNSIKKVFFDAKKFFKIAKAKSFEDVLLLNHLLTSSTKNNLAQLINLNLDSNLEELGFNKIFDEISRNHQPEIFGNHAKKVEFLSFKNFAIAQLYQIFSPQIFSEKLAEAYESFEKPSLVALAQMEENGIKIDTQKLHELSNEFAQKINQLSSEIYALAGQEFNIASPKQLGEILFEKLGLDSGKKSKKTGALSTSVGVLEELEEQGVEIARKILDFRKFSKLKNTYTDALPKEINPKTGRIHSHFSTTSTITGRLSSSNPNLQNIPIKSLEGQKIRQSFIAAKDHFLISADYSQVELRVIAHVAKIENLIAAFKADKDIHKITAAQVFGVPEENVDDAMRSKAKAINFGIIYGISAFGLAKQLAISRNEAGAYIKSYLEAYAGIDIYMKNCVESARSKGFVQTLSGRKCFIAHINDKNPVLRNDAERLTINAPIQGSAADIIKKAMINLSKKFAAENLRAKIVLQIHDELIVEAPRDEVEIASKILKNEMEQAVILSVPLKVDVKVGSCWS